MQERNDRSYSLGNEADKKKNTGEWSSERGVINQMCFCIIGNLVFLCACRFFFVVVFFYEVL